jgi:hypothetical protein
VTEIKPTSDSAKESSQQQQAAADAAKKLAADSDSGSGITGTIVSGMSHAIGFLESAWDYLPSLNLTGSAAAAAQKPDSKPAIATEAHPVTAVKTEARAEATAPTKVPAQPAINKAFASIEKSDKSFSLDDYLKVQGFDNSTKTPLTPTVPALTVGGSDFTIVKTATHTFDSGKQASLGETIMSKSEWQDVFNVVNAQAGDDKLNLSKWNDSADTAAAAGDKPTVNDGTVEKTADGYKHKNAKGQVDFEVASGIEIKHNADGTTSELNLKTGEKTLLDAHGKPMFVLGKDGFKGTTKDGTEVLISSDRKTVTITLPGGKPTTSLIANGQFTTEINGKRIVQRREDALKQISTVFGTIDTLTNGKGGMVVYSDSKMIRGSDGTSMFVGKDGTSAISLDTHSQVIRSPHGDISIIYNDGRPTVHMTKAQTDEIVAKHGKEVAVLAAVIKRLRDYGATGKLHDADGAVITKSADGVSAKVAGVSAKTVAGQTLITNDLTHQTQAVNLVAQTVTLLDKDNKAQGTLDFSGKTVAFKTPDYVFNDNKVTTNDGTVYSQAGIKFADGTVFQNNGEVTASNGTTYNTTGEAIAFAKPASSGTGDASAKNEESQAKAQVSQAESMASSIMGKVSGGHATAGDIAALLGSFEKLSSLVGSPAH